MSKCPIFAFASVLLFENFNKIQLAVIFMHHAAGPS